MMRLTILNSNGIGCPNPYSTGSATSCIGCSGIVCHTAFNNTWIYLWQYDTTAFMSWSCITSDVIHFCISYTKVFVMIKTSVLIVECKSYYSIFSAIMHFTTVYNNIFISCFNSHIPIGIKTNSTIPKATYFTIFDRNIAQISRGVCGKKQHAIHVFLCAISGTCKFEVSYMKALGIGSFETAFVSNRCVDCSLSISISS